MPIESGPKIDELHEEALEVDKNFQKATPVEEIIPGIKEPEKTIEEQQEYRHADTRLDTDYAAKLMGRIDLNYDAVAEFIKGKDKKFQPIYKENTPDLVEYCEKIIESAYNKDEFNVALELFRGQIIIDLAAGANENGYVISQLLKGKAYVGVNLWSSDKLRKMIELLNTKPKEDDKFTYHLKIIPGALKHHIPFSVVKNDVLTFLKRLPNNSVSIIMSGFGSETTNFDSKYREEISKEISRVLDPKGGFLNYNSSANFFDMNMDIAADERDKSSSYPVQYTIFKKRRSE